MEEWKSDEKIERERKREEGEKDGEKFYYGSVLCNKQKKWNVLFSYRD